MEVYRRLEDNINTPIPKEMCIQCGICAAICPKDAITIKKEKYNYLPDIQDNCINCGLCKKVCPQNKQYNYDENIPVEKQILGNYKSILSAKTKNKEILINSTSGGVITQLITTLLTNKIYDCAFLLDGYNYDNQLKTKYFNKDTTLINTPKSRYLTISNEDSCRYILKHPNEKVIIVGTGCVINGIIDFIKEKKLNKENYLLIGLFCDKTMNYGVVEYFKQKYKKKKIKNLFFRTKIKSGWPGDVRIEFDDNSYIDLHRKKRMEIKKYFVPECCLYCLNKLNKNSDISVGDNYIKEENDKEGKSSVIIRTEIGEKTFNTCNDNFLVKEENEKALIISTKLKEKEQNVEFAKIKGLIEGTTNHRNKKAYNLALKNIRIGNSNNVYLRIKFELLKEKIKNKFKQK
ncbi:Coenzyme F420 hydrogenase/dehydrogenase, beta subunit C-terminal domain [bacterium]|nr:Coenzyme F420 hydrogenase/dehydrogenase, beta subunit C-terminal domain [bacterium]